MVSNTLIKLIVIICAMCAIGAKVPFALNCNDILTTVVNYPIEKDYPNFKVYLGKINRESLIFRKWRRKSHWTIPDEAFNWHYYTPRQMRQAAGYPVQTKLKLVDGHLDIPSYFAGSSVRNGKVPLLHFNLERIRGIPDGIGSPVKLTDKAFIDHCNDEIYKFFIDAHGEIYFFPDIFRHEHILFREGTPDVLDAGYFKFNKDKTVSDILGRSINGQARAHFDTERYIKDYLAWQKSLNVTK